MSQELLYISIVFLILFLMYVYKKKCDEEYYISIINSTQKYILQNQQGLNYSYNQNQRFYNTPYPTPMIYNNPYNNNNNNYYNSFKTPKNRNSSQICKNYYTNNNLSCNSKSMSSSSILNRNENYEYHKNGNKRYIMEDQILYNKVNSINDINNNLNYSKIGNNGYEYVNYNRFLNNNIQDYNRNNFVNKKIFKLEDFLSGTKKNNLNERFNKIANDEYI